MKEIKKILASVLAATLVIGGTLSLSGCAAENSKTTDSHNNADVKVIKVGLSSTSSKNYFIDDKGNETGYEYELVKALDDALPQYSFEIVTTEFASLFVSLDSGTVDFIVGNIRRNDDREERYIHTTKAYNYTPYRIIVEETNNDINGISDLNGKKVGIGQGSLQATILDEYIKKTGANIELVYTKDYTNDLVSGRINAFIAPEFSLAGYNESFADIKFKTVGDAIVSDNGSTADSNAYIYLAKGNETLRDELSDAIYKLRENGQLSELITKFYDVDYTTKIDTVQESHLTK